MTNKYNAHLLSYQFSAFFVEFDHLKANKWEAFEEQIALGSNPLKIAELIRNDDLPGLKTHYVNK